MPPVRARAPCANGVHPCAHGCTRARTVMRDVPVRARALTVRARVTSIVTVRARVDGQLPDHAQTSTHMRRCVLHAVRARFVRTVITVRARGRCFTPVRERGPTMAKFGGAGVRVRLRDSPAAHTETSGGHAAVLRISEVGGVAGRQPN